MTMSPSYDQSTSRAQITVVLGDIVRQPDCDAIVNSANEYLIAGGGVCGEIYKAAGPQPERYPRPLALLGLGEAIASPGFGIPAELFNTRGPKYYEDPDHPANLAGALESAVRLADAQKVRRLAVPAISMGLYGNPIDEVVPTLMKTAFALAPNLTHLQEIRFTVVDAMLYQVIHETVAVPPEWR
jgi:O-acetyl-ADP-ribose deacetylase (regulator of RNase III)